MDTNVNKNMTKGDFEEALSAIGKPLQESENFPDAERTESLRGPQIQGVSCEEDESGDRRNGGRDRRITLRDLIQRPTEFSGREDFHEWRRIWNCCVDVNRLSIDEQCRLLPSCLSGSALSEYLDFSLSVRNDIDASLKRLETAFSPSRNAVNVLEFQNTFQADDENILDFKRKVRRNFVLAYGNQDSTNAQEKLMISQFLLGIRSQSIRRALLRGNFATLDDVCQFAQQEHALNLAAHRIDTYGQESGEVFHTAVQRDKAMDTVTRTSVMLEGSSEAQRFERTLDVLSRRVAVFERDMRDLSCRVDSMEGLARDTNGKLDKLLSFAEGRAESVRVRENDRGRRSFDDGRNTSRAAGGFICFSCGLEGHTRRQCRVLLPDRVFCDVCGARNHCTRAHDQFFQLGHARN